MPVSNRNTGWAQAARFGFDSGKDSSTDATPAYLLACIHPFDLGIVAMERDAAAAQRITLQAGDEEPDFGPEQLIERQSVPLVRFVKPAEDLVQLSQQFFHLGRGRRDEFDVGAHCEIGVYRAYWTRSSTAAMPWPTPTHIVTRA